MSYRLNQKLEALTPYQPISGDYKIRLDANESYFGIDEEILGKIKDSLSKIEFNRYPDPYCVKLCKAFGDYYGINPENVTAGNGSDELIYVIVGAFLEKSDKILTFSPDFSMYQFYGEILEHESIVIPKGESLEMDIDKAIEAARENNVKMILFSNPCNPTSLGVPKSEVVRLIKSTDALVVLDEAYMDFYGETLICEASEFDNVILLRTASKAVAMAGIRLGFAVANSTLTKALKAAKSPYNVNSITQRIGEIVYSNGDMLRKRCKAVIKSREFLQKKLEEINSPLFEKIYKSDANFVLAKTPYADKIHKELLKASISVRLLEGKYLRITAGSDEENRQFISALEQILGGIKNEQRGGA